MRNRRVWPAPIALGVLSAVGLTAALLSDGLGDVLAWAALAVPVVVVTHYACRRAPSEQPTRQERSSRS